MTKKTATQQSETNADTNIDPEVQTSALTEDQILQAIVTDEHAGKGGSFVLDPVTGKRTPADPA